MNDPPSEEFLQTAEDLLTFLRTGHPNSASYAHLQNALESYKSSFPDANSKNRHNKVYRKYNFPVEWAERAGIANTRASRWHKEHRIIEEETEREEKRKAAEQTLKERPAPTFTKFLQLPAEIRNMIWEEAITSRIIPMLPYWESGNYENEIFELRAYVKPCALSSVCRESRDVISRRQTVRDPVPMDPKRDTPYILGSVYDEWKGRCCLIHFRSLAEFESIAVDDLTSFDLNHYPKKSRLDSNPEFPNLTKFILVKHSSNCTQMELIQRKLEVTFEDPEDERARKVWKSKRDLLAGRFQSIHQNGRKIEIDVKLARSGGWRCCINANAEKLNKADRLWSQWQKKWPEELEAEGHGKMKLQGYGYPWRLRMKILKRLVWDEKSEESD